MAGILFPNSSASPSSAPPAPDRSAADIGAAAERQRSQFYSAQGGRALTMLTGGQGADEGKSAVVRLLGETGR